MKGNQPIAFILFFLFIIFSQLSSFAQAHGYIQYPASRSYLCQLGNNIQCGFLQYEPQSVEGKKNFPEYGPADGVIASAGVGMFAPLDIQTPTRWFKSNIYSGPITFTWNITVTHSTTRWRYFITKQNWNKSAPLSRASFNLTPFCQYNDYGSIPGKSVTHQCILPNNHTGYNIILGVWDISDTSNAFYQVIDVNIIG
ncbi:lytic polysaccharide monooxygenase [Yersinia ruckeri]|uniref:lytic polysaccharide monooxygenase n=1 Tax=Yersinia ruckeri TaxID=29486 RepID=UPI0022372227|nr:lytic polysaccharide monooxygenase [Yersinia ruckeri]MCW6657820.1 lytic polysaccharide monooxygenase [Yersinia ruckeri]